MTSTFSRVRKLPPKPSDREVVDAVNGLIDAAIQKDGPLELGVKTVTTSPYTLAVTDQFLRVDCSANIVTIVLPAIATMDGREITIKKVDLSNNVCVIDADGSETIDGTIKETLHARYQGITLRADAASEWNIKNWI